MAQDRDLSRWPIVRGPADPSGRVNRAAQRYDAFRHIRCPFTRTPLTVHDMPGCPGYEEEIVDVGLHGDRHSRAASCRYLHAVRHPTRNSMIGVCQHLQAPWIAHSVRKKLPGTVPRVAASTPQPDVVPGERAHPSPQGGS